MIPCLRVTVSLISILQVVLSSRYLDQIPVNDAAFQFLQYCAIEPTRPMLIFSSRDQIQLMNQSMFISCDGTFSRSPTFHQPYRGRFYQIYIVMAIRTGVGQENWCRAEGTPVAYILMSGKSQVEYEMVFTTLRQKAIDVCGNIGNMGNARWLFDFEPAAMNAIRRVLPNATVSGCLFHYNQAILRHTTGKSRAIC